MVIYIIIHLIFQTVESNKIIKLCNLILNCINLVLICNSVNIKALGHKQRCGSTDILKEWYRVRGEGGLSALFSLLSLPAIHTDSRLASIESNQSQEMFAKTQHKE